MKSSRYISASLLFSFILIGNLFQACSSSHKEKRISEEPVSVVTSLPSSTGDAGITASGQIESGQTAVISTRVMGNIKHIYVKVGDRVAKGQLLANISNTDILAQRAQADAAISEAKAAVAVSAKDVERFKQLYRQQSASAKELENVTLQYQSVNSKLETAKQMKNQINATLAYTRITAPFSGTITKKFIDEGSMANPGMPILALEQSGNLQAVISVPESDIDKVKKGAMVHLTVKSLGITMTGTIFEINPSSQFSGSQYGVKIAIPHPYLSGIKAGMYINVLIPNKNGVKTGHTSEMTVPVSSIINKEQLTGLYIIGNDHKASLRWIRLGKKVGDQVVVLSGLAPNERFVLNSQGRIYNGCEVRELK